MTAPTTTKLLGLTPSLLTTLRKSLERVLGDHGAQLLQEAGFSAGADVYEAFKVWLSERTHLSDPRELDSDHLGDMLSAFFDETGWGTLTLERQGSALVIDSEDWAEAEPGSGLTMASCNVSTGMLAALFGKLAGGAVAVMEVECRSRGDNACRFLVGSNDTLEAVFDAMSRGEGYRDMLRTGAD